MHSHSFISAQKEIENRLNVLMKKKQTPKIKEEAQKIANEFFAQCKARKKPVLIDTCGLEITGCELTFPKGQIGVKRWLTAFWPVDVNQVSLLEPNTVPLGFVNGQQLYLNAPHEGCVNAQLVARSDIGPNVGAWTPTLQGLPPANTPFFVALERARVLGYLPLFQRIEA